MRRKVLSFDDVVAMTADRPEEHVAEIAARRKPPRDASIKKQPLARATKSAATTRAAKVTEEPPPFARVHAIVARIPRGKVTTYGWISKAIDGRLTPVGVGWALRVPGDLPWHRVVNAKGGISTDAEHHGLQRSLLEAERVKFDADGRVDLDRYGWQPH